MQNTRPPSPLQPLLLLLLTIVVGGLLVILPYPYSNLVLIGMLLLAGSLVLRRAGYTERQILTIIIKQAILTLREAAASIANIAAVVVRFHRPPVSSQQLPVASPQPAEKADPELSNPFSELTIPIAIAAFVVMICAVLLALIMLPVYPVIGWGIIIAVGIAALVARYLKFDLWFTPRKVINWINTFFRADWAAIEPLPLHRSIAEILLVIAVALWATSRFSAAQAPLQYSGNEAEWLTSTIYAAHDGLRLHGRIPLWQPLFEFGEPLVENPFSFILNPFSGIPGLLFGGAKGVLYSVVIAAGLAGVGGWFMGRVLGLGIWGRLLLALLLIGKGNMHAMVNTGFYQLGVSQAYIPWVTGAVIAVLRLPGKRWPIPLLAVSITLLLFAGNLWYLLPTVVGAGVIALAYCFGKDKVDWAALRRLVMAGILAVGLSAVMLIPVVANFHRVGNHPPEKAAGWVLPLFWQDAVPLYFNPDPRQQLVVYFPGTAHIELPTIERYDEFFYSFVVPAWLLALTALVPLYRPGSARRFWALGFVLLVFATIWGAGGNPLFLWMYQNIPPLAQWRFVGRAFGVGAFWVAVLVAMRVDAISVYLLRTDWAALGLKPRLEKYLPLVTVVGLTIAVAIAAYQVNFQWKDGMLSNSINPINPFFDRCVTVVSKLNNGQPVSLWQNYYIDIVTLQKNNVRTWDIQADYAILPIPNTIGNPEIDLIRSLPEYGLARTYPDDKIFINFGYRPVPNSPQEPRLGPCLYRNPAALPYAYTLPLPIAHLLIPSPRNIYLRTNFPPDSLTEIPIARTPDQIAAIVTEPRTTRIIFTVQERAYPGWRVEINGKPAQLESFAGQLAVELPIGNEPLYIYWEYRPPLLLVSAWITIITSALTVVYLLFGIPFNVSLRRRKAQVTESVG